MHFQRVEFNFSCGSAGKESASNAEDLGSIFGLGRSSGAAKRLPTPVFWPGVFHRLYSSWGSQNQTQLNEFLKNGLKVNLHYFKNEMGCFHYSVGKTVGGYFYTFWLYGPFFVFSKPVIFHLLTSTFHPPPFIFSR